MTGKRKGFLQLDDCVFHTILLSHFLQHLFALFVIFPYNHTYMDLTILLYILGAFIVLLIGWNIRLELRIHALCAGKNGKSLEDGIMALKDGVTDLYEKSSMSDRKIADVRARLHKSIQKVETIRFNPFKGDGSGGNQSFISAFADEDGNGVILSCLYARGAVNVYAKPMKNFASEIQLSEEETEAVERLKNPSANKTHN